MRYPPFLLFLVRPWCSFGLSRPFKLKCSAGYGIAREKYPMSCEMRWSSASRELQRVCKTLVEKLWISDLTCLNLLVGSNAISFQAGVFFSLNCWIMVMKWWWFRTCFNLDSCSFRKISGPEWSECIGGPGIRHWDVLHFGIAGRSVQMSSNLVGPWAPSTAAACTSHQLSASGPDRRPDLSAWRTLCQEFSARKLKILEGSDSFRCLHFSFISCWSLRAIDACDFMVLYSLYCVRFCAAYRHTMFLQSLSCIIMYYMFITLCNDYIIIFDRFLLWLHLPAS